MTFRSKVEKILLEAEGGNFQDIVKDVKDQALVRLLEELPKKINELFEKRLKEVDKLILARVEEHLKDNQEVN